MGRSPRSSSRARPCSWCGAAGGRSRSGWPVPRGHLGGPGLEVVAQRRLAGAEARAHGGVLLVVVAGVAKQAHPVAAVGRKTLVLLPEVPEVVGVEHRRG